MSTAVVLDVKLRGEEVVAINADNSLAVVLGVELWRDMGGPKQISVIIAPVERHGVPPSPRPPIGGMSL